MSTKPNTSQITYDTGSNKQDLNNILDTVVPIADYTALRNYSGRATQVRITDPGIAGFFYYDPSDTTSVDNGGTVIVSGNGKRWKRLFDGAVNVKWFGATGLASGDDTSALSRALLSIKQTGGTIRATEGTYMIDPLDLREYNNVTIEGDNASTDWPYLPTTVFKFRTAGDVGFKLSDVTTTNIPAQSACGVVLKNLFIHGNSLVNTCVNMNRPTSLEHVVVRYAAQDGIVFEGMTYPVTLKNVNSGFNGRYGIHCKSPYTTAYTMYNCEFGSNGSHGLFIEGGASCVFIAVLAQSNGGDGFFVSKPDPAGFTHPVYLDRLTFIGCYTEGNAGWGFRSTSYNNNPAQFAGKIEDMTFINCAFNSGVGQNVQIRGTRDIYQRGSPFFDATTVDPAYNTVALNNYRFEGGITLAGGRVEFPATQNPSTNANTLDDYEEGVFTPVVFGSTAAGTATYSQQNGTYVKVGRVVTFNMTISFSGHTGTGDMRVSGMPFAHNNVAGTTVFAAQTSNLGIPAGGYGVFGRMSAAGGATMFIEYDAIAATTGIGMIPMDTAATLIISGSYITTS